MASHSKSRVGVQNAARGAVSLSAVIWWNEHTRSIRETVRPLPRESNSSTPGIESCLRGLVDGVEAFEVHRNQDVSVFFYGIDTMGLDNAGGQLSVQDGSRLFRDGGGDAVRARDDEGALAEWEC